MVLLTSFKLSCCCCYRSGPSFKMYNRIRPGLTIKLNDLVDNSQLRRCCVCGIRGGSSSSSSSNDDEVVTTTTTLFECRTCSLQGWTKESVSSFCENCVESFHRHPQRSCSKHSWKKLQPPPSRGGSHHHNHQFSNSSSSSSSSNNQHKSRRGGGEGRGDLMLELFAVICIESHHYVAFTKCGRGSDADWCFFDSMSNRSENHSLFVPKVTNLGRSFYKWISISDKDLIDIPIVEMEPLQKKLYCDAYLCMYQQQQPVGQQQCTTL